MVRYSYCLLDWDVVFSAAYSFRRSTVDEPGALDRINLPSDMCGSFCDCILLKVLLTGSLSLSISPLPVFSVGGPSSP